MILDRIENHSALMTLTMRESQGSTARKSHVFKTFLKQINENLIQDQEEEGEGEDQEVIHLNEEEQESIKLSQLNDLIEKHLEANSGAPISKSAEKPLNKVLLSLYKNLWSRQGIQIKFELLEVIKQNYGNVKSVTWKFLSVVGTIKQNENSTALMKVVSLLLKINHRYALYNDVNTLELADLYFRLFSQLTIKTFQDGNFNIEKACTTLDKIATPEFTNTLRAYLSDSKHRYVESKINELVATSRQEFKTKKSSPVNSSKRIQIVNEEASIIKLNPLLLYVLEVYLIEKQLYHSSYAEALDFIAKDGLIQGEVFVWLLDILGMPEDRQK